MQKHLAAGSFLTALLLFPAFCSAQTVSIVSGNGQLVCVNCPLSGTQFAPLVVQVNDATGNPVANTTVTWTDTQPDGQLTVATSTTGTTGQATYALGPQGVYIGPSFFPFTVLASALGAGVQFVETTQSIVPIEMPPQQFDRLIDVIDDRLNFGAHVLFL